MDLKYPLNHHLGTTDEKNRTPERLIHLPGIVGLIKAQLSLGHEASAFSLLQHQSIFKKQA